MCFCISAQHSGLKVFIDLLFPWSTINICAMLVKELFGSPLIHSPSCHVVLGIVGDNGTHLRIAEYYRVRTFDHMASPYRSWVLVAFFLTLLPYLVLAVSQDIVLGIFSFDYFSVLCMIGGLSSSLWFYELKTYVRWKWKHSQCLLVTYLMVEALFTGILY